MKKFIVLFSLISIMTTIQAQEVISLYSGSIPGAKPTPADYIENNEPGKDGYSRIGKISKPELLVYQSQEPNGTAVIICPGGGYSIVSLDKEGMEVAKEFNKIGVTAFVLKYRLPNDLIMKDKSFGPLQDALQAIYLVRKNAKNFNINPNKVGIMGFSAGGHLASSVSTHYADLKIENTENINLRPDFSILIYPVITFGELTHAGSVKCLLGEKPTDAQRKYFSSELYVNAQTPPTFMVHANNDKVVPVQNSINYNLALLKNNIPSEMHIYQGGGHGFGLKNRTTKDNWFERLKNWMKANKYLK